MLITLFCYFSIFLIQCIDSLDTNIWTVCPCCAIYALQFILHNWKTKLTPHLKRILKKTKSSDVFTKLARQLKMQ